MPVDSPPWAIQLIQSSQSELDSVYLPYAVGLLQAYCTRHAADFRRYTFLPLLCDRLPLAKAVAQVQLADVFGFSCYLWNIEYSLALAGEIKARKPEALVIFGGPQVPDRAEDFLRAHPQVDVCVHGEGERVFLNLLESLPDRDWDAIPGISWIDAAGQFQHHPAGPRIRDLDEIPSPYLLGIFDSLLSRPDSEWYLIWETNRGCPFSCSFCDWGSAVASKVNRYSLERLKTEIDWFAARKIGSLSCCDANFGILVRDLEIADYVIAARKRTGYPRGFSIQTAKNATERSYTIQNNFIEAGMQGLVTMALQSLSPVVLGNIQRENISLETYRELQHRFQRKGVLTYTDLLIGLPGETYDSFVEGICRVIDEGQHHWIQFYNVFLLPNAEMARPEYRQHHGLRTATIPYFETWLPLRQEVPEWQEMVIAAYSFSPEDWCRMRSFAWWVQILYFNYKLLQLPLMLLNQLAGIGWREIFEFFSEAGFQAVPMLQDLHGFLCRQASEQQQGKVQNFTRIQPGTPRWILLEDFVATGLRPEAIARAFFAEVRLALNQLAANGQPLPEGLLEESLQLSEALFLSPGTQRPFSLAGRYNLWAWYQARLRGEPAAIVPAPCRYSRDWYSEPFFDVRVEQLSGKSVNG